MITQPLQWTTRDLDAIPDDGGWKRYEIVEGELLVTRAPHIRHQSASGNLQLELELWSRQTKLGKSFQTPGLIFSSNNAVIPDLVWISCDRLTHGIDDAGHLQVAPELIVEVLSAGELNIQRDKDANGKRSPNPLN
jgi:Uma2 family endonuclease